jgi:6-phosphogluconolactonase
MMTVQSHARLEILDDADLLARRVCDWMLALASASEGVVSVCLSGGSTPRKLYEQFARPQAEKSFPWARTHWFWGDERFAPRDDQRSNFRMAREAFLNGTPAPAENIHPMPTENIELEAAAALYERELKRFYGADRLDAARPMFDVTLLGLGLDGHTASLFPGSSVLAERGHWVAAVMGPKSEQRITLTWPALESSAHVALLVAGKDKREILDRYLSGDEFLPATRLRPVGELTVFCDAAARPGGP